MLPNRRNAEGRQAWPRSPNLSHEISSRRQPNASTRIKLIWGEVVLDPLETKRDRPQHIVEARYLGPYNIFKMQDVLVLMRHEKEVLSRDDQHTARQPTLKGEVDHAEPTRISRGIDVGERDTGSEQGLDS